MQTLAVVKNFNVFEYRNPGFVASFEVAMMNQFDFQGVEKTLGYSINQPTGQCKGIFANPSTGQAGLTFIGIIN